MITSECCWACGKPWINLGPSDGGIITQVCPCGLAVRFKSTRDAFVCGIFSEPYYRERLAAWEESHKGAPYE